LANNGMIGFENEQGAYGGRDVLKCGDLQELLVK
jgi:hypothetical protein